MDARGNFYGMTGGGIGTRCQGGPCGTLFKITPKGDLTTLYTFQGPPNDVEVGGSLVIDSQGNIYGVGTLGGSCGGEYGCGAVFEFSAAGTESILYNFSGPPDGEAPNGPMVLSKGILYGTTVAGGDSTCNPTSGCGVTYSLNLSTNTETVLYTFEASTGNFPTGLMTDGQGNFYGTTREGGTFGTDGGVLFEFSPAQNGWNESVLYDFGGTNDGYWPTAGLLLDAGGDVFGTTQRSTQNLVDGTVFEITPSGQETIIHSFAALRYGNNKAPQGADPYAGVITDKTGNLYGTTEEGGNYHACQFGCGVVFRVER
jgi:uncharacterized repeat protein (TIGR03803 family)